MPSKPKHAISIKKMRKVRKGKQTNKRRKSKRKSSFRHVKTKRWKTVGRPGRRHLDAKCLKECLEIEKKKGDGSGWTCYL